MKKNIIADHGLAIINQNKYVNENMNLTVVFCAFRKIIYIYVARYSHGKCTFSIDTSIEAVDKTKIA